jgi:CHASE3 domain sensor protein
MAPSYDLALVAPQLRVADRLEASLASEEQLRAPAGQMTSPYAWLFWVVLIAVAVVLLVVIARMLPKNPPPA